MTDPARAAEEPPFPVHCEHGRVATECWDCGGGPYGLAARAAEALLPNEKPTAAPDGEQSTCIYGHISPHCTPDSCYCAPGTPSPPGSSAPSVEEALEAVERGLRDIKNALARALNTPEDAPATTLLVLADAVNCAVPDIGTALPVLRAAVEERDRLRTEAAPAAHDLNALHHRINELHEQIDATRTGIIDPLRASLREAEAARDRYKTERDAIPNEANVGALLDLYNERWEEARARAAELERQNLELRSIYGDDSDGFMRQLTEARAQVAELEAARDVSLQVKSDLSSLLNQAGAQVAALTEKRERLKEAIQEAWDTAETTQSMEVYVVSAAKMDALHRAALGEGGEG